MRGMVLLPFSLSRRDRPLGWADFPPLLLRSQGEKSLDSVKGFDWAYPQKNVA